MAQFTPKPGFAFTAGPPKEVVDYLAARKLKPGFDYRDVWKEEHVAGFTVAKAMSVDVLTTFKDAIAKAEQEGIPFRQFAKELKPQLQKLGWWGVKEMTDPKTGETRLVQLGSPRRLQVIYRTNLAVAHSAGRWERLQRTKATRPFLRYSLGPSVRHREQHVAFAGTVLPIDHAFWTTHYPPNGWGCKCYVRALTREEVKAAGGPSKPPKIRKRRWKNNRTGKTAWVPEGIDPGWDYNPGRVRMQHLTDALAEKLRDAPPALAAAAQGRIPLLTEDVATARQIAPTSGTHPGGVFEGSDGVRRYVKHYDDPAQGYSEAVAAGIYRELGLAAPEGALFVHGDKLSLATRFLDNEGQLGKAGLTKARAEQVLDGYVADVWLANRDVLGNDLDNVVVTAGGLARIDNGGALLFRGLTGRKPPHALNQLAEWGGFANPSLSSAYSRVFKAAGLSGPDELGKKALDQIKAIEDLGKRTRDFEDLVPPVAGVPPADRDAILQLLRNRATLLDKEIAPRVREFLKSPKEVRELKALLGSQYQGLLASATRRVGRARGGKRGLTDPELISAHAYTGSWFVPLNEALRAKRSKDELRRLAPMIHLASSGLDKLPDVRATLSRGTTLPTSELALHQPGNVVTYKAFTSASTGHGFGGPHKFTIASLHGKDIRFLSAYPGEEEVLFKPGTRFKVLEREQHGSETRFRLMEVE